MELDKPSRLSISVEDLPSPVLHSKKIVTEVVDPSGVVIPPPRNLLFSRLSTTRILESGEDDEDDESLRPRHLVKRIKKAWSWLFILYFLLTIFGWGMQDFLLSYMATRKAALSSGDTLAFLAIGNLFGTFVARVFLWRWKRKASIEQIDTPPQVPQSTESETEPEQLTRFQRIRKMLKTPQFLKDGYKLCFLSGMLGSIAPLGYYMLSIGGGQASTVAPLISLYILVPTILGLVFRGEKKTPIKFLGIFLAIAAVVLFALGSGGNWTLLTITNFLYYLLGFFGWGFAYFMRTLAAGKVVDYGHMLVMAAAGLMFGNYLLLVFWFGVGSINISLGHILTIVAGTSSIIGDLGYFLMSKEGKEASKVAPLTGTYVLIPAILGFAFLKDTVTAIKIVGIVLAIASLILLGASRFTTLEKEDVKAATKAYFVQIEAPLKIKDWTDWYLISEKQVNRLGGKQILKRFRSLFPNSNKSVNSFANALMKIYPEHPWNLQNFKNILDLDTMKEYWKQRKNQKKFLENLGKSLGYKEWEDWYQLDQVDVLKQGGLGILHEHGNSLTKVITINFPQYEWKIWRFKFAENNVWKDPKNQKEFFEYAKEKLSIKEPKDWYNIKLSDIQKIGGQTLLKLYRNAVSAFVPTMEPNYYWLEWKFEDGVPQTYWRNSDSQKKFLKYVAEQLKVNNFDDWTSVNVKEFRALGGTSLLAYHNGDLFSLLKTIFPEHPWSREKFEKPKESNGYWSNPIHVRAFFERIAPKFGVSKLDDWYNVTFNDLASLGGIHMLNHYGKSLPKALAASFPEHNWMPWRFERTSKHFWDEEENVREVLKWIENTLDIKTKDDWYGITTQQLNNMGFGFLLHKHGGIAELLQKYYPDHNWNFLQPRALNKRQNQLFKVVSGIFPHLDVIANHPMENLRYDATNRPMELDIFIPSLNLAFEYQGEQHYKARFFTRDDIQQSKDSEKRKACKEAGIALIEVPYWWDSLRESIEASILEVRPDLRSVISAK